MSNRRQHPYIPRIQDVFRSEMDEIKKNLRNKKLNQIDPLPSPMDRKEDGVDHINIWEKGKTNIGRALAQRAVLNLRHNILGNFKTVEGFWHYLKSKHRDDRFRYMSGVKLRELASTLEERHIVNFRALIMDANYQKITQYPLLMAEIKSNPLPFDCYYLYKGQSVRQRPKFAFWTIAGFEEIRRSLIEDRPPDLTFLMDDTSISLEESLDPNIKKYKKKREDVNLDMSSDDVSALERYIENDLALSKEPDIE